MIEYENYVDIGDSVSNVLDNALHHHYQIRLKEWFITEDVLVARGEEVLKSHLFAQRGVIIQCNGSGQECVPF